MLSASGRHLCKLTRKHLNRLRKHVKALNFLSDGKTRR